MSCRIPKLPLIYFPEAQYIVSHCFPTSNRRNMFHRRNIVNSDISIGSLSLWQNPPYTEGCRDKNPHRKWNTIFKKKTSFDDPYWHCYGKIDLWIDSKGAWYLRYTMSVRAENLQIFLALSSEDILVSLPHTGRLVFIVMGVQMNVLQWQDHNLKHERSCQ